MSFKQAGIWPCGPNTARGQTTKIGVFGNKIVYANGRTIIIRDLKDPGHVISYAEHTQPTTVARISPSGYYCASADTVGNVRIWDIVGEDNVLKGEYRVLGGRINDLAWDGESKRLIAVGDGKDKFGHAFMMDSGSSTGEIIGHSKAINAVAIRHQRPFKAVTSSDDRNIGFHSGVPFKYERTISTHNNFVLSLAYSPSSDYFASSGADCKVFIYDGKTGDTLFELENPHTGSVNSVNWSPDSKSIVTSSADCTVKLWDIETQKSVVAWTLGTGIQHQQVGNAWAESDIVSLSVSGDLNILDSRLSTGPARILHGLQKAVTCSTVSKGNTFIAGSADGRVVAFTDFKNATANMLSGEQHSGYVSGLASTPNSVWSVGYDDRVREISSDGKEFTSTTGTATASQPKAVAAGGDLAYVAESNAIEMFRNGTKSSSCSISYEATSIAVSISGLVAVGGQDSKVRIYDNSLKTEKGVLENNKGAITTIAFSPDSKLLVAGDSVGKIVLYDIQEMKFVTSRWSFHTARVNSLSWTADSLHVASASLDTDIYVWSVKKPLKTLAIKNAVPGGANTAEWIESSGSNGIIAAAGADPSIRVWEVTFHP